VRELREKLKALSPDCAEPTCPAERFLRAVKEEDPELSIMLSDLFMNSEVPILSLQQELKGHGYKIGRESMSIYKRRVCRCDPHCSELLGGGNE
jgi:hypothetical protein